MFSPESILSYLHAHRRKPISYRDIELIRRKKEWRELTEVQEVQPIVLSFFRSTLRVPSPHDQNVPNSDTRVTYPTSRYFPSRLYQTHTQIRTRSVPELSTRTTQEVQVVLD